MDALCQWLAEHFHVPPTDDDTMNALCQAALGGHLAVCQWLVQHFYLTPTSKGAEKVLSEAALGGQLEVCQWLAVRWECRDEIGFGPLYPAVAYGHVPVCRWLAEHFHLAATGKHHLWVLECGAAAGQMERAVCAPP